MARIGLVAVLGGLIVAVGFLLYMSAESQTNLVQTTAGETVKVGPVNYVITFEGTHEGSKEVQPEHTFVKIGISAKYVGSDTTILSGGQFLLMESNTSKYEAVYGEFSSNDLLLESLEPNKPVERTTQFDIQFDAEKRYDVLIKPQKGQPSSDIAKICILNCG